MSADGSSRHAGLVEEIDYGTPASKSEKMVSLTIDGNTVSVPEGTSIMRAAMEMGTKIPKLCATDMVDAFGSCRLCLVEIEGRDRLGRTQSIAVDLFAGSATSGGDASVSWPRPATAVFQVVPDRPRYKPGEVAKLVLESPFQNGEALAVVEAYGMTRAKPFREPAQKAVNFILKSQNPYAAWRYASPGDGDNDTSVTGWMVMVLKSAKLGGLTIDDEAINNALGWVDQMTNPATGRTGYTEMGGFSSRPQNVLAQFPAENTESMTAVGVLIRFLCGRTASNDPMIDNKDSKKDTVRMCWLKIRSPSLKIKLRRK